MLPPRPLSLSCPPSFSPLTFAILLSPLADSAQPQQVRLFQAETRFGTTAAAAPVCRREAKIEKAIIRGRRDIMGRDLRQAPFDSSDNGTQRESICHSEDTNP